MAWCCVQSLGWVVLTFLGAKTVYNVLHFIYTIYLAAPLGRNLDPRNYGPWVVEIFIESNPTFTNILIYQAVVTGATDGLGKAYAKQVYKSH